ncbi:MAG: TonB-dependent receptor [Alphaproteobacteria bacterium]|nr:TonB-dependent receptor [Alphaproteobacteria bacterium]
MAAFVALLVSVPAFAGLTTGSLRVIVEDDGPDPLPIPGVTLQLTGENLIGGAQTQVTNNNGEAQFVELPPGLYAIKATKDNFSGVTVEGIHVDINREAVQRIKMQAGQVEEIVVEATRPAVDVTSTTQGSVLTKEFLNNVPTGRSYQSAVQLAAGVTGGGGGNPNIGGGAFNENTYMLDGANITDPVTGTFSLNFNFDAIQQIEVLLGGYMPEYGVSIGGIVNVVTESGTNNLEFQSSVYYNNGNWAPKTDERLSADGVPIAPTGFDSQFQLIQISSKISGPVVRDKAWFIISYQSSRTVIANVGIPQARDYEGHYILAKLTMQPTPEHRLAFFVQSDPTTVDNVDQNDPYTKAEAQTRQAQGGFVANARWQWFLSPEVNLDSQVLMQKSFIEVNGVPCTHDRSRNWNQCRPDEMEGDVDWETPGRFGVAGAYNSVNTIQFYFDDRFRYQASTKLSLLSVEDPLGGTHDFKFGAEGSQLVWDQVQGLSGNSYYYDVNLVSFDPNTFTNYFWFESTGPIKFRTTASEYNVFAQDSWKPVSNLTLNYGSRLDSYVMRNDLGEPVLQGVLLGPRLFGAWDPWGDQKTKIATGYGRFNDTGRLGVASYTSASNYGQKLYIGEVFAGQLGQGSGFMNSQQSIYALFPKDNVNTAYDELYAPRVDQVLLTLEREVVEDVAVYSTMSGKFSRYLYEPDETNLIFDSDGSAIIGSRLSDPLLSYGRLRTPALAKRDYFQWDLGVRKVDSHRWAMEAVYTYTQSIGSSTGALSGSFMNDPQTQYNYGPLNTDLRSVFKSAAYWNLPTDPWTQTLGLVVLYFDGYPEERLYYSDATQNRSLRVRPRGTYFRFVPSWWVNANFTQTIDLRKGALKLDLEVFNILNSRAPDIGNGGYVDFQNRNVTVSRQDPTRVQLGATYEF